MALEYSCFIQGQWFEVPRSPDELELTLSQLDGLVDAEPAREPLRRAAQELAQFVARDDHPDRHTWGGVGDRSAGNISAVLTIESVKLRGVSLDDFLTDWSTNEPGNGIDVWLRRYEKRELAGRRAVSGHEILQAPEEENGQRKLTEMYRAAVAAPGLASFVLLTITTDDLAVFDDIVGYGDMLADTIEFAHVEETL